MENNEELMASILNENVIGHILRKILKVSLSNIEEQIFIFDHA